MVRAVLCQHRQTIPNAFVSLDSEDNSAKLILTSAYPIHAKMEGHVPMASMATLATAEGLGMFFLLRH